MEKITFKPPKMPFEYTEEQADIIMRYMQIKYRAEDILGHSYKIKGLESMKENEQLEVLMGMAEEVNEIMVDYGISRDEAITEIIIRRNSDYENRL